VRGGEALEQDQDGAFEIALRHRPQGIEFGPGNHFGNDRVGKGGRPHAGDIGADGAAGPGAVVEAQCGQGLRQRGGEALAEAEHRAFQRDHGLGRDVALKHARKNAHQLSEPWALKQRRGDEPCHRVEIAGRHGPQ